MKIALLTCTFALSGLSQAISAEPLIQPNDTLAICGDSITAEHLYSAYMEDYLLMCEPTNGLNIVQFGWGGEVAPFFLARLDTDVFPYKPTIVTTSYGMNDGGYGPINDKIATTYRTAQTAIVEEMKKHGVRTFILGSPKCVDSFYYHHDSIKIPGQNDAATAYNQTLSALADIDKDIAAKEGISYADVFGVTLDTMKKAKAEYGEDYYFAGGDGIHPGPNGSLVMAYVFLKALGCSGDIATITVDLNYNSATVTKGQDVESFKDNIVSLKSTRYPFCFSGTVGDKNQESTAGVFKFIPFNEDLNRYILIVKGLKSAKAKITWGAETHEYTAEDLTKGVNLAADFMNNPFRTQFFRVHEAVVVQQREEMYVMQGTLHEAKNYVFVSPSASTAVDQWISSGLALREALLKSASALVLPIEHTIKIEPST